MQNNLTTGQLALQGNKCRITSSNSSLIFKFQDLKKTSEELPRQCRICLQGSQSIFNQLINPCGCDGTVKFVHQDCIKKWISSVIVTKNKQERIRMRLMGIQCQMCKFMIKFQMTEQVACKTCEKIKRNYYDKKVLFIILTVMMIISLGGVISTTYYVVDFVLNLNQRQVTFYFSLILGADILMLLILIVGFLIFVTEFLLQRTLQIGDLIKMKIPPQKKPVNKKKMMPLQQANSFQQIQTVVYD